MSMSTQTPYYDFTPYEVNRVGRVAPEQQYWLGNACRLRMFLYVGLSLILLCTSFYNFLDFIRTTHGRLNPPRIQVHDLGLTLLSPIASLFLLGSFILLSTCAGLSLWRFYAALIQVRELAEGQVFDGVGSLRWHTGVLQDVYVAEVGGRRLFCALTAIITLLPGSYRLYYLPRTGLLIAAERIEEPPPHFDLLKRLSEACNFTFAALAANRTGHLAPQQRRRRSAAVIAEIAITTIGFLGAEVLFVKRFGDDWPFYILPLLLLYLLVFMTSTYISRQRERRRGPVSVSEGQVRKLTYEVEYVPAFFFEIGDKRFRVSEAAYDVLDESLRYRVYYPPKGNRLISIEPLASETASAAV